MSKVIITCFLVNLLINLCLAATIKEIKKMDDLTTHHVPHYKERLDLESQIQQMQGYIPLIKNIIADPKKFGSLISTTVCTSEDNAYSKILNGSMKILIESLINKQKKRLTDIHIPQLPHLKNIHNDKIDISDLTFKKSSLKGIENLVISKFDYNVCTLSFEIEIIIPKLEITSTYTLNGNINGSSIFGDGEIIVTFDMVKLNEQSTMGCNLIAFMDDVCELSYKNKTTNLTNQKVTVHMANIKYKDLSELQINDQINKYINNYNKSNKMGWMEKTVKLVKSYMKKNMKHFNTASLLEYLYNVIHLG